MIRKIIGRLYLLVVVVICNTHIAYAADNNEDEFLNKRVLITLTISSAHDQTVMKRQIAAKVIRIEQNRIVLLPYGSRVEFGLPPDTNLLIKAKRGIYTLENGNVYTITNPDFTADMKLESNSANIEDVIKHGYVP